MTLLCVTALDHSLRTGTLSAESKYLSSLLFLPPSLSLSLSLSLSHVPLSLISFLHIRYGSFYGHDEQSLNERYSTCKRTADYVKTLPKHQFEVDMPNEELGKVRQCRIIILVALSLLCILFCYKQEDLKKMYRQSVSSK